MKQIDFQSVYSEIVHVYEKVNKLLTLGLDTVWRYQLKRIIRETPADTVLDLCCGTGITTRTLNNIQNDSRTIGLDMNQPVLKEAKAKDGSQTIAFIQSSASDLPMVSDSVDLITITFALRNLDTCRVLEATLNESKRVLKPGGVLVTLETSRPQNQILYQLLHSYSRLSAGFLGMIFSKESNAYSYLGSSVGAFHDCLSLARMIKESGFCKVELLELMGGVVAIHRAIA